MAADLLAILIKTNLAAAAAILLVLAIRKPARKAFGARLTYGLWLAIPFAVGASFLPTRKIFVTLPAEPLLVMEPVQVAASAPVIGGPDASSLAVGLWLLGLIASGLLLAWRQSRFMANLGGVRLESGYLRAKASDAGPMVVGALRPRIILPTDFETRFDASERDVVLAHEMAHLKAGDTRINALVALVQCIAWFNPLVHVAARYLRFDQELACDAAVLAARPTDRLLYAKALLKAQTPTQPLPLGCYWPAGANPLKERIIMLKSQSPSRRRAFVGAATLTAVCAGAGAAAWAAQPAQTVLLPGAAAPLKVATSQSRPLVGPAPVQFAQAGAYPSPPRPTQIAPRPAPANPAPLVPEGANVKTFPLNPATVTGSQASARLANSAETPLSLVTKAASAKSNADCVALFPYLASGTSAQKAQRINEQQTCLNQFSEMTPSLLRQHMNAQGSASQPPRPTQITPRPAPVNPAPNVPAGAATSPQANSTETPLSLVTKSAAAKSKADCLAFFPSLTTGTDAQKTQRINEQATCLNQWNEATPSMLRQFMNAQSSTVAPATP